MQIPKLLKAALFGLLVSLLAQHALFSEIIYETDFENFTPGVDALAGTDGWLSTVNGLGVQGIDEANKFVPGVGQTAYLGFFPPGAGTSAVSVFRPLNIDPTALGTPLVEFEALIDIADSRNDPATGPDESLRKDRFLITIYNSAGQALGSVIYDLRPATYGLWRNDGSASVDTGIEFILEEPQHLLLSVDMECNTWSASLEGVPVFTDAPFNSTSAPRNLGTVAAEWKITTLATPGNNWMLFDDWFISTSARPSALSISKVERIGADIHLMYAADAGCHYSVKYSTNLTNWLDLPGSPFVAPASDPAAIFVDVAPADDFRYYHIERTAGD